MNRRPMAEPEPAMDQLAKHVTPLAMESGDATVPDALADMLEGASVVGLGEATHGTAEFTLD